MNLSTKFVRVVGHIRSEVIASLLPWCLVISTVVSGVSLAAVDVSIRVTVDINLLVCLRFT